MRARTRPYGAQTPAPTNRSEAAAWAGSFPRVRGGENNHKHSTERGGRCQCRPLTHLPFLGMGACRTMSTAGRPRARVHNNTEEVANVNVCAQVSETSVALPILTGYVRRGTEKKRGARTPPASAHTFFFLCTTCNLPMATELLPQGTSSCYWSAHKEGPRGVTTVTAAPRTIKETPPNVVSRVPRLSGNTRWPPARHQSYPYRGANALARGAVCLWRTGSRPYPIMSQGFPP